MYEDVNTLSDDKPRYRRRRHFTENGGSSRNGAAKRNEAVDTVGMKVLKHGNTYYYGATDIREKGACQAKRGTLSPVIS